MPKTPVAEATITAEGVEGDRIAALQAEGHPIAAGTTGENLTVSGLDWDRVRPGTRLAVGEVTLEITKYTTPCVIITASLLAGDIARIAQKTRPGWSRVCARVLVGGRIRVGDTVALAN